MTQVTRLGQPPATPGAAPDALGVSVLSKLGHELRSPVTGIIGLTKVMLMRLEAGTVDPATQARQLGMIQSSAARALATIEKVTDVAKIDSGRLSAAPQAMDGREVVAEVASKLGDAAAGRGLPLRADVPDRPVMVTSDPEIVGRLLHELVENALKFADAGEVRIRLHASGPRVVIEVSDDGPGIPADEQARIFEPFERGQLAAERDDGSGLGLYLARRQADLLGARLDMTSQAGSGSTFSLTFTDHPGAASVTGTGADPRS
jgi:signal transduction histidine kinase